MNSGKYDGFNLKIIKDYKIPVYDYLLTLFNYISNTINDKKIIIKTQKKLDHNQIYYI